MSLEALSQSLNQKSEASTAERMTQAQENFNLAQQAKTFKDALDGAKGI
jgi:hypothetical protein